MIQNDTDIVTLSVLLHNTQKKLDAHADMIDVLYKKNIRLEERVNQLQNIVEMLELMLQRPEPEADMHYTKKDIQHFFEYHYGRHGK
jgi:hypothetical protein